MERGLSSPCLGDYDGHDGGLRAFLGDDFFPSTYPAR
jgi:hypothetical protein